MGSAASLTMPIIRDGELSARLPAITTPRRSLASHPCGLRSCWQRWRRCSPSGAEYAEQRPYRLKMEMSTRQQPVVRAARWRSAGALRSTRSRRLDAIDASARRCSCTTLNRWWWARCPTWRSWTHWRWLHRSLEPAAATRLAFVTDALPACVRPPSVCVMSPWAAGHWSFPAQQVPCRSGSAADHAHDPVGR
jgi:hypothetical protein